MSISENKPVVRVTFRCLTADLANEVGPPPLRAAIRTIVDDRAADVNYLLPCPLTAAEHPLLDRANMLATDEAAERERIKSLADRTVYKVKTGDRRGALWQDDDGVWWLLAAGRRKNDSPGDFYREIERHSSDATPIAPTEEDRRYLRFEAAYAAECALERAAQAEVLGAVLRAARHLGSASRVEIFGAEVSIKIEPDEHGEGILEIAWDFASFEQQDRFPMDVLAMVPGREDIDSWDYMPPAGDGSMSPTWYTLVSEEWVDSMATSAELDELLGNGDPWHPPNPVSDGSENYSHYAAGYVVTLGYLTGIEFTALCGASLVAHRDYERFPTCAVCIENRALLRSLRELEAP